MAYILEHIQDPVKEHLKLVVQTFNQTIKSKIPLLNIVIYYLLKSKGKQMRPLFVLLSAQAVAPITERTYRAATLIELLHTASLVHDDVVDDSQKRRGFFSINAIWKNKIAVLLGDYLLARGLLLSVEYEDFDLLKIVSGAVKDMSEGELLQIEKARRLNITEEIYFEIISKKTASLIEACCATGVASVSNDTELINRFKTFGLYVGIAFQIKDDLLDYSNSSTIGKPAAIDIKEKKLTLPLIYTLNKSSWLQKKQILYIVKHQNTDAIKVAELMDYVVKQGGIEYAHQKMQYYKEKAIETLLPIMDSIAKQKLIELVHFTIERKK